MSGLADIEEEKGLYQEQVHPQNVQLVLPCTTNHTHSLISFYYSCATTLAMPSSPPSRKS